MSLFYETTLTQEFPPPGGAMLYGEPMVNQGRGEKFRPALWRWTEPGAQVHPRQADDRDDVKRARAVLFVGLNPSTATATQNDLTVTKFCGFARGWGYDLALVGNLFDLRTKDPMVLLGALSDAERTSALYWSSLLVMAHHADQVVVCWGGDGFCYPDRVREVRARLLETLPAGHRQLYCLGLTKHSGRQPKHPSRIGYDTPLVPWNPDLG